MRDEQNADFQKEMIDYLISLMDDANDFNWEAAKASHAVLMCRMEQGKVHNYIQTYKIDCIRRANMKNIFLKPVFLPNMLPPKNWVQKLQSQFF